MRILVSHPGPAMSVSDVYRGWVAGLRENGCEVVEYDLDARLHVLENAFVCDTGGDYRKAFDDDQAIEVAWEAIGTWIYETQPDVILFISGFWLRPSFLEMLRARGERVVLLCTESPYEDDTHAKIAPYVDLCLLNDPSNIESFRELTDTLYVPHSYDPAQHCPGPSSSPLTDLCVIGTGFPSRVEYLERMNLEGIDVALLGHWSSAHNTSLEQYVRHMPLNRCTTNSETIDWYRNTSCSLNLYRRESNRPELAAGYSMGPREVELAATGTFFLSEERGENAQVLPMVPKIDDPLDATEKLRWWLAHPQERHDIAQQARAAISSWTFTNRSKSLLQYLERTK